MNCSNSHVDEASPSVSQESQAFDCYFLRHDLGPLLSLCIAEIVTKCPRDPIEYMGQWLRRHAYNQEIAKQACISVSDN